MKFGVSGSLATIGLALAALACYFALPADEGTADDVIPRAVLPLLSGDTATGFGATATATKTPGPPPLPVGCAGVRSSVRTLSDAAASFDRELSDLALSSLITTADPATVAGPRIGPFEAQVVRVEAWLTGARAATGGSTELLIANAPGDFTVVAGIPGGACTTGASEADQAAMSLARVAYLTSCGPAQGTRPPTRVIIEGVPHWTPSSNGPQASIWPVLNFELEEGWTCSGQGPTATPSPTPVPDIDVMYLSVDPQVVAPGGVVVLTIETVPPGPGHSCTPLFMEPPPGFSSQTIPGAVARLTDANGEASWSLTIPADSQLGQGSFQVQCAGQGGGAVKIIVN